MKIVLLGGGGLMARATARDLLESRGDTQLVLADVNLDAARRVADSLRAAVAGAHGRVTAQRADASDADGLRPVLRGADAVINAAQYYFNIPVMHAALAERVPYVDLGGLFHVTREQLPLHREFERAGVTAVIGMGSTPGITNVQARHAIDRLGRVESIGIYCANTPEADTPDAFGYSIHTILDELTKSPVIFRDGAFVELEPLAEPARWDFVEPIGGKEVHLSLHSEIATLPTSFADRGLRECFFKLNYFGFTPDALRRLKALVESHSREAVVARLAADAKRRRAAAGDSGADRDAFVVDHEEVAVEVRGDREGRSTTIRVDTMAAGRADWRISGGTLITATPPGIVATWLAEGSLRAPGVHPPETVIESSRLFAELERRGMRTTLSSHSG